MSKIVIIVLSILFAILVYLVLRHSASPTRVVKINIKSTEFSLEVAETISQKTKGLMNRETLCPQCGMVFISSFAYPQIFWMKNTLIPLDMIFIDSQGKVVNIATATPEPPSTPDSKLKLYQSSSPAQYVIEVSAGQSQKLGLIPGDTIDLSPLQP